MSSNQDQNNSFEEEQIKYDERGREQVKAWYALVVFPGRELKIRDKLIKLAQNDHLKNQIFRIIVPATKEEKMDAKGKVKIKEHMIYTQYVYVEMILNDDTYHAVKIDGVRHILGAPTPISDLDIKKIFEMMGETYQGEMTFEVGDEIQIVDKGLTALYRQNATITEIDKDKREAVIMIEMFGRETPTKVKWDQITKK